MIVLTMGPFRVTPNPEPDGNIGPARFWQDRRYKDEPRPEAAQRDKESEMTAMAVGRRLWPALRGTVACVVGAPALAQTDTGPAGLTTGFWAPYSNPVNSVVSILTPATGGGNFIGTGTIIGRHPDADPNFGWLCVLTANHVVDPNDPTTVANGGFSGPSTIQVASNFTSPVESYGGATNQLRLGQRTFVQNGLAGVDIAVLGVRVPSNAPAYTLLSNVTLAVCPTPQPTNPPTQFSEIGFGGTGTLVNGGISAVGPDGNKRFQNNTIATTINPINYGGAGPYGGTYYQYNAIQFTSNKGTAAGFSAGAGFSFGGDSGGPYMTSDTLFTSVPAFQRDGPADPNNWPGGSMPFFSNTTIAVHAFGNTVLPGNGQPPVFNAYGKTGGGVPLSQNYIDWINRECDVIPAPGTVGILLFGGIVAIRRRRA